MFFGAGNLIFPPIMGAQAGTSFTPAIIGFLIGAVVLPVVAIIAVALSGTDLRDLASRPGRVFGVVFSCLAYLSIGAFYALPRTGAVSFSTAVVPLTGWDSTTASILFNAAFFGLALYLAWNPSDIINKLGKILTPILLGLLALLVALSLTTLDGAPGAPVGPYEDHPLTGGLLAGYMTMDSIAGLAFGIIVVTSLGRAGGVVGAKTVRRTAAAATIAGALLAVVYIGLGLVGRLIPEGQGYEDGALLLADASHLTMGRIGQGAFGLIVLTACMTTAVGLLAATSEFFQRLLPSIAYRTWLVAFAAISFALASAGLSQVLAVAGPIIGFLYPIAITIIFTTLIGHPLRLTSPCTWTFRLSAWTAAIWSACDTVYGLGWGTDIFTALLSWSPGQRFGLGWIAPTLVAAAVGLLIDLTVGRRRR
ncbi:branched-chain amino acid transport system II carrier protein [Actinomyces sp. B33]|nr:branched-chain amino acid transport system II carrier protein [Actinomyces sp. B33]